MHISKISSLTFRAENTNTADNKPKNKVKEFISDKKNLQYIIEGGAVVTAAIVIGIAGAKRGWFSRGAKQVEHRGEGLIDNIKPNTRTGETVGEKPVVPVHEEEPIGFGPFDDSEILSGAARGGDNTPAAESLIKPENKPASEIVETQIIKGETSSPAVERPAESVAPPVINEETVSVISEKPVSQTNNTARLTDDEVIEAAENLKIFEQMKFEEKMIDKGESLTHFWNFSIAPESLVRAPKEALAKCKEYIARFDERIENLIRSVGDEYSRTINVNDRRYMNDFEQAFKARTFSERYDGTKYETAGNIIRETKPDGSKILYKFEDKENGGLLAIKEVPNENDKMYRVIRFLPDEYWAYGKGNSVHKLDKIEYYDAKTNKLIQGISIDSKNRSFHNAVINNPETGKPVIIMKRKAKPDKLYYDAILFDKNGKPFVKFNTSNNAVLYVKE